MRWLLVLLVACGNKAPEPPSRAQWETFGAEQRCEATAARASRCIDDFMIRDLKSLADDQAGQQLADEVGKELRAQPSSDDEARTIHRNLCAANPDHADGVLRCWQVADCKAFVDCVATSTGTP